MAPSASSLGFCLLSTSKGPLHHTHLPSMTFCPSEHGPDPLNCELSNSSLVFSGALFTATQKWLIQWVNLVQPFIWKISHHCYWLTAPHAQWVLSLKGWGGRVWEGYWWECWLTTLSASGILVWPLKPSVSFLVKILIIVPWCFLRGKEGMLGIESRASSHNRQTLLVNCIPNSRGPCLLPCQSTL